MQDGRKKDKKREGKETKGNGEENGRKSSIRRKTKRINLPP
jgi:hypothetical protein